MSTLYVKKTIVAVALLLFLVPTARAQYDVAPDLQVSVGKSSYRQFEPVLLEISLTNPSNEPQRYGPIGLKIGWLRVRLFNPNGERIYLHGMYQEFIFVWDSVRPTSYAPGETEEETYNLLILYPIGQATGTYTAEVGFPVVPGAENYKTASVSFEVLPPEGVPPQIVKGLGKSKYKICNMLASGLQFDTSVIDNLERVLESPDAPPYMKELALYLKELYQRLYVGVFPGAEERADSLNAVFLERYPNSVYASLARSGYLTALDTEMNKHAFIPALPAALTVASGQATGAFAGDAFRLDGRPHTAGGQLLDQGTSHFALAATSEAAREGLLVALMGYQEDNLVGTGDAPSVAPPAPLPFDADSLAEAAAEQATQTLSPVATGTVGTAENPVIAHAPQGLDLSSTLEGYGILIVDGMLAVSGDLHWTGLVIVRGTPSLSVSGTARSIGALLVVGRPASIQVANELIVKYSPEALEQAGKLLEE